MLLVKVVSEMQVYGLSGSVMSSLPAVPTMRNVWDL